jgi:hypothetical protein
MSEKSKNVEGIDQKKREKAEEAGPAESELLDKDLEQVAGGGFNYQYLPPDVITLKKMDVPDPPLAGVYCETFGTKT